AIGAETQGRVGAVAVVVHHEYRARGGAGFAIRTDFQAGKSVRLDIAAPGAQFSPGNRAVAIGVQADRELQVAQRDVPLAANCGALDADRQVAVARLVRLRSRGVQESEQDEKFRSQGFSALSRAAACRMRAPSKPLDSSHCMAG